MQKLLLKTIAPLMVLMIANWIPFFSYSQTDSVTVSRDAQRKCVKCLLNEPVKDSTIADQNRRIEIKDSTIQAQQIFIGSAKNTVLEMDGKLLDCNKGLAKLEARRKRGIKIGAVLGATGGVVVGILAGQLIK